MRSGFGRSHLAAVVLMTLAVGSLYSWGARSAGYPFNWTKDEPGYYNFLGRAFASGHLYLPVEPSPQLLAQPNPWDPHVDGSLRLFDAVLFNRRYYLYHGAGPAVLLFAPYRLVTGKDLPENFGLFLLCFGGFVFSTGALLTILRLAGAIPGPLMLAVMLAALGVCQDVPFLLSRVWVYEIAIGGGYFFLSGAVFLFARSFVSDRLWLLAASGLMFGLAIACRPHLGIAGVLALPIVAIQSRRRLLALAAPFLMVGILIAAYNFARFGDAREFGTRWQLSAFNQGQVKLAVTNAPSGLYYLFFARPVFSPVFPWVELPWPPREFPRPSTTLVEQTVGGLFLAPFIVALPLFAFARRVRVMLSFLALCAAGITLVVVMTGWSTQRYEVDFLPVLVLASLCSFCAVTSPLARLPRVILNLMLSAAILFGCVVNLALGISGPYWEMIHNKPQRFVRIARWFSPMERYTPASNPGFDVNFELTALPVVEHLRDTWLTAARYPNQYELYAERVSGKAKLFSNFAGSVASVDLAVNAGPTNIRILSIPGSGNVQVFQDGAPILSHSISTLVTAPSQIEAPHKKIGKP